jgi:hypothetical protein
MADKEGKIMFKQMMGLAVVSIEESVK